MSVNQEFEKTGSIAYLCDEYLKNNFIDPEASERLGVKRGLRNPDGTGVLAGLTNVCDVVGYDLVDGKRVPTDGKLIYRGIDVEQIVRAAYAEYRFVFEEVIWLYSYDDNQEEQSLTNILSQSIALIASLPTIMVNAYQIKRRVYDRQSMYLHLPQPGQSTAEHILSTYRADQKFTKEEAKLLDLCLVLHADHGGGNNSTFACRVLSSSGTDTYSAISAAIGSLKGPKHGGANHKVMEMLGYIMEGVKDHSDDAEIAAFLRRILRKEAGDGSGLIYGMGHAVYTKSDPRAVILRRNAEHLAVEKGFEDEFRVLCAVERLGPDAVREVKGTKDVCANVDLFSGLIYRMLGISEDLFTPLFAISRIPGWCAHRVEEVVFANRIMRPAYKYLGHEQEYIPLEERG